MSALLTGIGWVHAGGIGRGRRPTAGPPPAAGWPAGPLPALRPGTLFQVPARTFARMDAPV